MYYSTPPKMPEVKGNWCHSCFMEERKETLEIDGAKIKKTDVVKRKNDEEQEEAWVACDQCNRWVHQICGLFNKGRNDSDVPYICPECLARGTALVTASTFLWISTLGKMSIALCQGGSARWQMAAACMSSAICQ